MSPKSTIESNWYLKVLLFQSHHLLSKLWTRELRKSKITLEKFAILHEISNFNGNPTPHAIAKATVYEPAAVSAIIGRLEKDGFITKHKDLKQKNMVRIEITQQGRDVFTRASRDVVQLNQTLLSVLPNEEKDYIIHSLSIFRDHLLPLAFDKSKKLTNYKSTSKKQVD
ncbi:MarR family winged helix-turn-helix transcriptional regulator [Dehalococcoides mccartyi]|jgi:DNA-binding MarR family transcriptional regulator|uniref:MarR family transcriptional regulator n=2 Tax=Dehalococcoides mccartyi TaxID=61435 RepID=A0A142VDJ5_9CHLR|nr:MarR family transcriptional regulator [Dehalococcoides mccartyi]AII61491.1 MarR family transcriptional regulator [Dehalococcoides mccartyi CG5]AMU87275.1 MarR family transcriptional regulator [Dehalococcoides mccartyi]AQX73801.1 MarR family transcriptional regulator [Dehalococcoides mccartyi]MBA2084266.1 transcriptional regulator, MarR family [Dehalococcoides mccartyi]QBX64490.1 MarR family transcriptional regulator [Dehalococcoides mccartyi]